MNNSLVFTVILNWNGWKDTIDCVNSLLESSHLNHRIVIVDNKSTNDSISRIEVAFSQNEKVLLIQNDQNMGFAAGNNVGIRHAVEARAEYIFVLNNDTIVEKDCIRLLVDQALEHAECGLFGPKIYDFGTTHYRQWAVKKRLNIWSILGALSPFRRLIYHSNIFRSFFHVEDCCSNVYAVPGSAMFFRAEIVKLIGFFDEYTFLYWEEFIIAEKLRRIRSGTRVVVNAKIWHRESASISKIGSRKFIENVRSERYFFRHYLKLGLVSQLFLNLVRMTAYLARCLTDRDYREKIGSFFTTYFEKLPMS
jgi:GT2 family glycosyltransferase